MRLHIVWPRFKVRIQAIMAHTMFHLMITCDSEGYAVYLLSSCVETKCFLQLFTYTSCKSCVSCALCLTDEVLTRQKSINTLFVLLKQTFRKIEVKFYNLLRDLSIHITHTKTKNLVI